MFSCFACQILIVSATAQEIEPTNRAEAFAIGQAVQFDHPDSSFIESLLKVGLYDIAIETCRDRQRIGDGLSPDALAQWNILEMHSIAAKTASDPSIIESPASVAKLLEPIQLIVDRNQDSSRSLWLKQQLQWCRWFVLRRMQAAYVAVPARTQIREFSLTTIRACLEELESLQSQIQKTPERTSKPNNKSTPTPEQWSSLINDTLLLQTDFLLLRTLYYPPKSTDRIAAATEMANTIDKASNRIGTDWHGYPNVELARCTALIHLERPADALACIQSLNKQLTAPVDGKPKHGNRWQLRIATLAAEASRNLGNLKESNRWLDGIGGWTAAPEIAIEHFANLVASSASKPPSESQIAEVLQIKKEIGNRFGSYWQQRADAILLANNLVDQSEPTNKMVLPSASLKVEVLMSEAKQLLAAKRSREGIEKLGQAETAAASAGDERLALDIAIQASAVLFKNSQIDESEAEFHRAALTYSKQAKAPDAAIMSVLGFNQAVRFDPDTTKLSQQEEQSELKQQIYRGRLMDIVNTWPNSDQAKQAVAKLDGLFFATDAFPELLAVWLKRLDHADSSKTANTNKAKTVSEFDQAISRFALVMTTTQDAWYDRSIYSSELAERLQASSDEIKTKLISVASVDERESLRAILEAISELGRWPSGDARNLGLTSNASTASTAITYLSFSTESALPKDPNELEANLDAARMDPTSVLALRWTRTELLYQRMLTIGLSKPMDLNLLANFRSSVEILRRLDSKIVGGSQTKELERSIQLYQAATQCWSGDEAIGVQAIQKLVASETKSAWWKYRTARLLQSLSTQREQAMAQFRKLANGFPAGSDPWLEARARTVQTMRLMGNQEEAKKLTELVFLVYPNAATTWKERFSR
ncbi:MAG: hypothetical protein NTY15_17000 [Planctomycetota bacterium]|nr:hypothetical protein [Planctomycetota bacterium]